MLVTTAVAYLLWLKDVGEIAIPTGTETSEGVGKEEIRRLPRKDIYFLPGNLRAANTLPGHSPTGEWIFSLGNSFYSGYLCNFIISFCQLKRLKELLSNGDCDVC